MIPDEANNALVFPQLSRGNLHTVPKPLKSPPFLSHQCKTTEPEVNPQVLDFFRLSGKRNQQARSPPALPLRSARTRKEQGTELLGRAPPGRAVTRLSTQALFFSSTVYYSPLTHLRHILYRSPNCCPWLLPYADLLITTTVFNRALIWLSKMFLSFSISDKSLFWKH